MTPFGERLANAAVACGNTACVGLDPHLDRLPGSLRETFEGLEGAAFRAAAARAVLSFNRQVIEVIEGRVPAVKPQFAFYEQLGSAGWQALEQTVAFAHDVGLLVVGDAKRGDIQSTGKAYARAILAGDGPLGCDAVTLNPWMGTDTLDPMLEIADAEGRGVFVLVRTTNPGSSELQSHGEPTAAHRLAATLGEVGNPRRGPRGLSNVGAVVGAQTPRDEVRILREKMPSAWFLVPGYGAQGGGASDALNSARADGLGALVAASRSVTFPRVAGFEAQPMDAIDAAVLSLCEDLVLRIP